MARRGRTSLRDMILASNAADRFYAASYGKEPQAQHAVAAKRMYTRHKQEGLTELQHGIRLCSAWETLRLQYALPSYALFHIPNGGGRGSIEAANLKRSGVRPGVEDYLLTVARGKWHGLFIELKVQGGRISPEQEEMAGFHFAQGYQSFVCWSYQEAIDQLIEYLDTPN